MHKVLHVRGDIDKLYVSREVVTWVPCILRHSVKGRIEERVYVSIQQGLENYIKKSKEKQITAASNIAVKIQTPPKKNNKKTKKKATNWWNLQWENQDIS